MDKLSEKELKELKEIRLDNNEPKIEEMDIKIIKNVQSSISKNINKQKYNKKEHIQYKVSIPKKFAEEISLNVEDFEAKAFLHTTPEKKIIIEIIKKK